MKKILVFLLVLVAGLALSENTLIAVVNNTPISLHSVKDSFLSAKTKEEKSEILNAEIDFTLQLQKVSEFNLSPSTEDVKEVLFDVALNNNISIDDLLNFDGIDSIVNEIVKKLSILNLQRFITMELEKPTKKILNECSIINPEKDEKQIKIAQIIISEIDSNVNNLEQKNAIIQ